MAYPNLPKNNDKLPVKPKRKEARPITDKFDIYKVPLEQVRNAGGAPSPVGQYQQQHIQQTGQPSNNQTVYWTVPYNTMTYNYEAHGYGSVPPGSSLQPGPYPLPQMDPNYYMHTQGGGPFTAYGYPATNDANPNSGTSQHVNFGNAPYASPWADVDYAGAKSPPPSVTVAKEPNGHNEIMQKVSALLV